MPKAVVFLPQNPYPPQSGFDRRCLEMLQGLQEAGYSVNALSLERKALSPWTAEAKRSLEKYGVERVVVYEPSGADANFLGLLRRYHALTRTLPRFDSRLNTPPEMRRWFSRAVEESAPDTILSFYALWDGLIDHHRLRGARRLIDNIDLVTLNWQMWQAVQKLLPEPPIDAASVEESLLQEDFFQRLDLSPLKSEFQIYDRYNYTLAISGREAQTISRATRKTTTVHIPMTQEVYDFANTYQGPALLPTGPNPFNVQGYLYFVRRVLPLIQVQAPDFCLQMTGYCCERVGPHDSVQLSGFVPDLKAVYQAARLSICPVFGGTGQQVKIVEAMAHGVPVVALRAAAEQSPIEHGVNGLVAENAAEFAEHVIALWKDKALCRRLGEAARECIRLNFSCSRLLEALVPILR